VKLEAFRLEQWLELHPQVEYNLASSTGPTWKLQEREWEGANAPLEPSVRSSAFGKVN
jgi:hypothetical protein